MKLYVFIISSIKYVLAISTLSIFMFLIVILYSTIAFNCTSNQKTLIHFRKYVTFYQLNKTE